MKLNLHLVRIFYYVVECNSFSKAAECLFISQSAVSKAIVELESQLNLPLIERAIKGHKKTRTIKLTENGQALFEHARAIFALERAAINDLQARIGLKKGQLTVGTSTTVASYWLPSYLASLYQDHPEIELEVKVGNTEAMRQLLINCEVDFAIIEGEIQDERIEISHWREEELNIVTAPQNTITMSNLDKQVWIIREKGSGTRTATERIQQQLGLTFKQKIVLGSNEGIARTVAKGIGVAILPACTIKDLVSLKHLKIFSHPAIANLTRPLYLLELKDRPVSPLATSLLEKLKAQH